MVVNECELTVFEGAVAKLYGDPFQGTTVTYASNDDKIDQTTNSCNLISSIQRYDQDNLRGVWTFLQLAEEIRVLSDMRSLGRTVPSSSLVSTLSVSRRGSVETNGNYLPQEMGLFQVSYGLATKSLKLHT